MVILCLDAFIRIDSDLSISIKDRVSVRLYRLGIYNEVEAARSERSKLSKNNIFCDSPERITLREHGTFEKYFNCLFK